MKQKSKKVSKKQKSKKVNLLTDEGEHYRKCLLAWGAAKWSEYRSGVRSGRRTDGHFKAASEEQQFKCPCCLHHSPAG